MKKFFSILTAILISALLTVCISAAPTAEWLGDHSDIAYDDTGRHFYSLLANEAKKGADGFLADVTLGEDLSKVFGGTAYGITVNQLTGTTTFVPTGTEADKKLAHDTVVNKIGASSDALTKELCDVYMEFLADHPQYFWLTGKCESSYSVRYSFDSYGNVVYTVTTYFLLYSDNGTSPIFDVRCEFHCSPDVIAADIKVQENAIESILALPEITGAASVSEKLHAINDVLISRNAYYSGEDPSEAPHSSHIGITALTGASGKKGPVCEGYSRAFKILCDRLDIPCVTVNGYAVNNVGEGGSHMWNAVYIDGAWYGVDVTWDDPLVVGADSNTISGCECDKYFLVGNDTIIDDNSFGASHKESENPIAGLGFPLCNTAYGISGGTGTAPSDPPIIPFADVLVNHKYFDDILYVYRAGLMNGVSGTRFAPDAELTRSMLVTILWRFGDSPKASANLNFSDVPDSEWYANAVAWASSAGIVTGYTNDRFAPNDSVTREQALVILARYVKSLGITADKAADISSFHHSKWAEEGVGFAAITGIISGEADLTVCASRAEIASYLNRFSSIVNTLKNVI